MTLHIERQSSTEWQEGVRWENRMRAVEIGIEDIKQQIFWFYILTIGIGLMVIGSFIYH